jgi:hypothetical protein
MHNVTHAVDVILHAYLGAAKFEKERGFCFPLSPRIAHSIDNIHLYVIQKFDGPDGDSLAHNLDSSVCRISHGWK